MYLKYSRLALCIGPHRVHKEWIKAVNAKIIYYKFFKLNNLFDMIAPDRLRLINSLISRIIAYVYRFLMTKTTKLVITEGGAPLIYGRILKANNESNIHINLATDSYPFSLIKLMKKENLFKYNRFFNKLSSSLKLTDLIIANSVMVANDISEFCKKYFINVRLQVVYPFIDISKYLKINPYNKEENIVVFIGAHYPMKGIKLLPLIFKRVRRKIPDVKFLIIGKETYYTKWLRLYSSDNFEILGYVKSLVPFLKKAKLLIHPAIYESFGISPLDALAAGVVPIVSYRTGSKEFISKVSNELVIKLDIDSFANKIVELLTNEDLRLDLAMRGREIIRKEKELRKEYSVTRFLNIIKELLEKNW